MTRDKCSHTWRDQIIGHEHRCGYEGGHTSSIHNCWCGATRVDGPPATVAAKNASLSARWQAVDSTEPESER